MQDAPAGGHPLDVAGLDPPGIADAVLVLDGARQHVGDGLDAPVGMGRESCQVIFRIIRAKMVQEQEWVRVIQAGGREAAF